MMDVNASNNTLVSIILPTYKRAYVLSDAINSILNQTYTNIELIIVDDNSPDNTSEIVSAFSDSRIRYVKNDSNLKLPGALNKGFSLANGDYFTWTSDDNIYAPNAIEKMAEVLRDENCNFVYADYFHFVDLDINHQPIAPKRINLPDQIELETSNHIGACFLYTRKLYKKIGLYDEDLFLVEDYDYFMRIAKCFTMTHLPIPLYYFRRDANTLFCSRYDEIKALDVLVRYKNGFLNEQTALEAVISIILDNIEDLKNPILRWTYRILQNRSYRLTLLHKKMTKNYLRWCLRNGLISALNNYRKELMTFKEAGRTLSVIMQSFGTIEYRQP